jgi:catechol 2,3-dioxygenase-like lactoylglutathione lyase family enzyme
MTRVIRPRTVLAVQHLERSRRYYVDILGFTEDDITSPGWAFLSKDAFHLMLGECPDEVSAGETGNHSWYMHLLVDDVDGYYAELRAKGALLVNTPTNREYGLREFILTTPDGHRLMIAQEIR